MRAGIAALRYINRLPATNFISALCGPCPFCGNTCYHEIHCRAAKARCPRTVYENGEPFFLHDVIFQIVAQLRAREALEEQPCKTSS